MNEWKYISHKLYALVAPDGEVLEEIYGDHTGYRWTVTTTGKAYYGEQAAKAAAEKHAALNQLNRAAENNGEEL